MSEGKQDTLGALRRLCERATTNTQGQDATAMVMERNESNRDVGEANRIVCNSSDNLEALETVLVGQIEACLFRMGRCKEWRPERNYIELPVAGPNSGTTPSVTLAWLRKTEKKNEAALQVARSNVPVLVPVPESTCC